MGAACESRADGNTDSEAQRSAETSTEAGFALQQEGVSYVVHNEDSAPGIGQQDDESPAGKAKALLVELTWEDDAGPMINDETSMRFEVYSALCPSSPCASGLALEDISILSFTEKEVQIAILPPPNPSGNGYKGSATAVKADLLAQLEDKDSSLRKDVLGDIVIHSKLRLVDAAELALSSASSTDRQDKMNAARFDSDPLQRGQAVTPPPHGRMIPHRGDRDKSFHPHHNNTAAFSTRCITMITLAFLMLTAAHVTCERICRWIYPGELRKFEKVEGSIDGDGDEIHDRDFRMIRSLLEATKYPLGPANMWAITMFMVQARARELTRGFGDAPQWADHCMIAIMVLTLLQGVVFCVQARISQGSIKKKDDLILTLFTHPTWQFVVSIGVTTIAINVLGVILWHLVATMTMDDCRVEDDLRGYLDKGGEAPPLSLEHKVIMSMLGQYFLALNYETICILYHATRIIIYREYEFQRQERKDAKASICTSRLLCKTSNLAPLVCLIILAAREVPIPMESDRYFRAGCMYWVAAMMLSYTAFVLLFICCNCLDLDTAQDTGASVVSLSSGTDYLVHLGDSPMDSVFRVMRRIFLFGIYGGAIVLCASVFFLSSESGPAPVVEWPILWAMCLMMQSLCVNVFLMFHELLAPLYFDVAKHKEHIQIKRTGTGLSSSSGSLRPPGAGPESFRPDELDEFPAREATDEPPESKGESSYLPLLASTVAEVEGFMAFVPQLALLFLVAHLRALEVMETGHLPQWVLTAMNAVAQTILLQLICAMYEGVMSRLFAEWTNEKSEESREDAVILQDGTSGTTIGDFRPGADSQDAGAPDTDPHVEQVRTGSRTPRGGRSQSERDKTTEHVEASMLSHSVLNFFITLVQISLLTTLVISTELIIVAVWTMNADMPQKTYSSGDWRSSIFPLLPVSSPTSTSMECMVWFIALFFSVKFGAGVVQTLRNLYDAISWSVLAHFNRASEVVDLIPLACLVCLMAQSRAASYHGITASPPYFIQTHMVVFVAGMTVDVLSSVATPAITSELSSSTYRGLIPSIRRMVMIVEIIACVVTYWAMFVILVGIAVMRPEHVVLPSGKNGLPWRGKGDPPAFPFVAWNMWALCLFAFAVSAFHRTCHQTVMLERFKLQLQRHSHAKEDFAHSGQNAKMKIMRQLKRLKSFHLYRATLLARQSALGAVMLGVLFVPLVALNRPRLTKGPKWQAAEDRVDFMKMLFFIASLALAVKTFLVFCFGVFELNQASGMAGGMPRLCDGEFIDEETGQQPILHRSTSDADPRSQEWEAPTSKDGNGGFNIARRLALPMAICEFIAVVALAGMLLHTMYQNPHTFKNKIVSFSVFGLFVMYMVTHTGWGFLALFGYHNVKADALLDIASFSPLIMLLVLNLRQRALEVAGFSAIVPTWIQKIIFTCTVVLMAEFVTVLFAPEKRTRKIALQAQRQTGGQLAENQAREIREEEERSMAGFARVIYLFTRTALRFALWSCLGAAVFALFWMTEEQCLPKDPQSA